MPPPKQPMEDGISFARLQELYQPTMKKDRMYSQDLHHVTYLDQQAYPAVRYKPPSFSDYNELARLIVRSNIAAEEQKRILVTGGCGFVGSHLVDRLMLMGHQVICLDNFQTGHKSNIAQWIGHPHFELVRHDVVNRFMIEVDQIYHLACPASPPQYQSNPIKTVKTSFLGTYNMLGLAKRCRARFLLASTSEIYGDPEQHPQTESYWGHVNPIGPRSCYDEGKRIAETLTYEYLRQGHVDTRVARIFNTYGPRQGVKDGRLVSNFITSAIRGTPLEIYGDGTHTRSFCYVDDLVQGLIMLMESDCTEPVNLGNPEEFTVREFADMVLEIVAAGDPAQMGGKKEGRVVMREPLIDDPKRRRPDISRAREVLVWVPRWTVRRGLEETAEYYRNLQELTMEAEEFLN